MAKKEEVFPAKVPSLILTATQGDATVVTKLYGEVTPQREAKERKEIAYRAGQLATPPPRRERVERPRFVPNEDHWSDPLSNEQTKPRRRRERGE